MMRSPARTLAGHLMWARSGTVWATWRLQPAAYGFRSVKDKEMVRAWHQALFRALPGESLLLGLCADVDPASVVDRMLDGVNLEHCPDWAAECDATLDTLGDIDPSQRTFWLSVPLSEADGWHRIREPLRAAEANLRDALGLPRVGVSAREIELRVDQADRLAHAIPAVFSATPASAAQQVWIAAHAQRRGLIEDLDLPDHNESVMDELIPRSSAVLPEPLLDEGGQTDSDHRPWNALSRRYLKVAHADRPGDVEASYQALLALAAVPEAGMLFPGSEFVGRVDESGLDVDWAIRLNVRSSDKVLQQNRRALVNLNEQFRQREGEVSHGLSVLDRAAQDLAEYAQLLEADKLEVECQATIIFCVASRDPDDVLEQAKELSDYLGAAEFRLDHPVGYQEALWWAMLPGVPATQAVRDYTQITTARALAAAVPITSSELGDARGSLLGLNITTARAGIVMHDLAGASDRDISGSIAIAGEKGGGKSLTLKKLAGDVVDRGGRVICIDRTQIAEYATWAGSVTDATVADVADPAASLDPLRLFGPKVGSRAVISFLTPLLNVSPTSDRGVLLSDVLDPLYLADHRLRSLGDLLDHLRSDCELAGASELARLMNVFARRDFGRVIFDPALPPLDYSARAVVIRTHTLELPDRNELDHEHLFHQMRLEKVFGRAMYALATALARQVCFADSAQFAMFVADEAHHITASPEGEREIIHFIRDDRKHRAAIALGSHDPMTDFGSATLRGLIPTRILMRHRDKTLAKRGLEWLDMDPADEDLIDIVTTDTSPVGPDGVPEQRRGEAFLRDGNGNMGRIKVLAPMVPARNTAARTTPPETQTIHRPGP